MWHLRDGMQGWMCRSIEMLRNESASSPRSARRVPVAGSDDSSARAALTTSSTCWRGPVRVMRQTSRPGTVRCLQGQPPRGLRDRGLPAALCCADQARTGWCWRCRPSRSPRSSDLAAILRDHCGLAVSDTTMTLAGKTFPARVTQAPARCRRSLMPAPDASPETAVRLLATTLLGRTVLAAVAAVTARPRAEAIPPTLPSGIRSRSRCRTARRSTASSIASPPGATVRRSSAPASIRPGSRWAARPAP